MTRAGRRRRRSRPKPLPWLKAFLAEEPVSSDYGTSWTRLPPESTYQFEDDGVGEGQPNGWTRTFPHALTSKSGKPDMEFIAAWPDTPQADAYPHAHRRSRRSTRCSSGSDLNRRDVLAISYSVLDHVGHPYGPRSHEVQDVLARLDLTLRDLLDALDKKVGRDHYVLALTGDHGVSPIPEQMSALGFDAVRMPLTELRARIDKALEPFLRRRTPHVRRWPTRTSTSCRDATRSWSPTRRPCAPSRRRSSTPPAWQKVYRGDLIGAGIVPQDGVAPPSPAATSAGAAATC